MIPSIKDHSGNKYIRKIYSCVESGKFVEADVYEVIDAFNVTCPAISHAIKKLLCTGVRGKGTKLQDLKEAIDAMYRAVQKEEVKNQIVGVEGPLSQMFGIQIDIPKEATQKIEDDLSNYKSVPIVSLVKEKVEVEERKNIHPFYAKEDLNGYVVLQCDRFIKRFDARVGCTWDMLKQEAQNYADELNRQQNAKFGIKS